MKSRALTALAALAVLAALPGESLAQAPAPDKAAVERIVRDYLLANPEIVAEALQVLRARQEAEEQARAEAAIAEHREAIDAHPMSPVSGNMAGDVTVVEFFDYQCGYCKRALPTMVALLETDANVRVVWKEFPILGPVSDFAARASMAAERQGKYHEFHVRLMGAEEKLTEQRVMEVAARAGLDVDRLGRDMEDPAIRAYLDETRALAQAIGIRGTPSFVIEGRLVRGIVDSARMEQLVAEARADG